MKHRESEEEEEIRLSLEIIIMSIMFAAFFWALNEGHLDPLIEAIKHKPIHERYFNQEPEPEPKAPLEKDPKEGALQYIMKTA